MPGYNHYAVCLCGWCVNYGRRRQAPRLNHDVAYARAALERYGVKTDNFASCFVRPNASCPVCNAKVFFYANDRGSRVYFDHLGRPWPKHGCTDGRKGFGYLAAPRRTPADVATFEGRDRRHHRQPGQGR